MENSLAAVKSGPDLTRAGSSSGSLRQSSERRSSGPVDV